MFAQTMTDLQGSMGANHAEGMAMLEHYGEELAAYQESVLAEQQATRAAVTHVVEGVGSALSSKMDDNTKAMMAAMQASMAKQEARSNAQTSLILAKVASTATRRGSVHNAADVARIAEMEAQLVQARANNVALAEAKGHVDRNDAAAAAASIADSGASDEVKESAAALLARGNAAMDEEDWAGAVGLLKAAAAKDPSMGGAWFGVAYCLGEGRSVVASAEEAIPCYQKVIEINPEHASAHYNLG